MLFNMNTLSTAVDKDNLSDIMEEVVSIRSAFYSFGRSLKLKFDDLRAIREAYLKDSDVEIALENVLVLWLDQKYDVAMHGLPCWRALVKAVDSEAGGKNHELAMKIASKHLIGNCICMTLVKFPQLHLIV